VTVCAEPQILARKHVQLDTHHGTLLHV
jgi:hypothetical protein